MTASHHAKITVSRRLYRCLGPPVVLERPLHRPLVRLWPKGHRELEGLMARIDAMVVVVTVRTPKCAGSECGGTGSSCHGHGASGLPAAIVCDNVHADTTQRTVVYALADVWMPGPSALASVSVTGLAQDVLLRECAEILRLSETRVA